MKYLPVITLFLALALSPVASAQNGKREGQKAKHDAAMAKFEARVARQPAPAVRGGNRANVNAAAAQAGQGRGGASYNSDASVRPRGGQPVINRTGRMGPFQSPNGATDISPGTNPNGRGFNRGGVSSDRSGHRGGTGRMRGDRDGNGARFGSDSGAADFRNGRGGNRIWEGGEGHRRGGHDANNHRNAGRTHNGRGHHGWHREHQNRSWWRSRYNRFALFGGGYYYLNSGYWYPAYGYDPYFSTYSYDAPIYAYNDQNPGDVIANVQTELQRLGYSVGGVDGQFGPATRRALLNFQRDNGLPTTGEIDETTLEALGLE